MAQSLEYEHTKENEPYCLQVYVSNQGERTQTIHLSALGMICIGTDAIAL